MNTTIFSNAANDCACKKLIDNDSEANIGAGQKRRGRRSSLKSDISIDAEDQVSEGATVMRTSFSRNQMTEQWKFDRSKLLFDHAFWFNLSLSQKNLPREIDPPLWQAPLREEDRTISRQKSAGLPPAATPVEELEEAASRSAGDGSGFEGSFALAHLLPRSLSSLCSRSLCWVQDLFLGFFPFLSPFSLTHSPRSSAQIQLTILDWDKLDDAHVDVGEGRMKKVTMTRNRIRAIRKEMTARASSDIPS
ncbi:hypothetical protein C8J56DRAFT_899646 [Mycena floridula]|nr:hypothetical protein C8J56DRAFT_899646 [Mycena floridula]